MAKIASHGFRMPCINTHACMATESMDGRDYRCRLLHSPVHELSNVTNKRNRAAKYEAFGVDVRQ